MRTTASAGSQSRSKNLQMDWKAISDIGHAVQFYEDENFLLSTLHDFVAASLANQAACILIITKEHSDKLKTLLKKSGVDITSAQEHNELQIFDANTLLGRISSVRGINWKLFEKFANHAILEAQRYSHTVHLFGELVALLQARGDQESAIKLEDFWNKLSEQHEFFLYCAYPLHGFSRDEQGRSIALISEQHTEVIPEESYVELLAERQQLAALNVAKDDFISLASHQLRTPATIVKQFLGLVLQGYMGEVPKQQRAALQKAYDNNDRQIQIINDLLLVARVEAGKVQIKKSAHDVVKLIKEVVNEEPEITKHSQIVKLSLPRSLSASIDPYYIRMVLENLLNNASKYSPDSSTITIKASPKDGQIAIAVSDQGVGISKKDRPLLYQRFSRIHSEKTDSIQGTGLGLYWSKQIISLHDGQLTLKSRLNHGSTFTILLPVK